MDSWAEECPSHLGIPFHYDALPHLLGRAMDKPVSQSQPGKVAENVLG
eukprot:CAMPEP_0178440728 /NCGR_PEP_ID=MMETSP0689_2-20121128/36963_1 /TAXON_ID=160604 /ORGANISM="Amphidinium massartii, Strain CS-259" /LENGTH=47 /DNA_ID= /DNA_START= /DNA_END= /DNA_ORIENTATION=